MRSERGISLTHIVVSTALEDDMSNRSIETCSVRERFLADACDVIRCCNGRSGDGSIEMYSDREQYLRGTSGSISYFVMLSELSTR